MIYVGIPFILLVIYSATVHGTQRKLASNNIRLKGTLKILFPLYLLFMHIRISLKLLRVDYKQSISCLKMFFFHYPQVVGLLIELYLEAEAFALSKDEKIKKITKRKQLKRNVPKTNVFSSTSVIFSNTKITSDTVIDINKKKIVNDYISSFLAAE
ncbi:hypothetical protein [Bacillus altitudinis]|uniref:hypothetical protein n=1 Tax=Bacillus altitudinis TaxID=293387 RepID=UPI0011B52BF3|nr:hypothetical protein [Bacillus altitudinis]QDZ93843.1 hypothetical protein D0438_02565 [Bacillus altitudinis]